MWLVILLYCQQIVAQVHLPPQPSLWDPTLDWPGVTSSTTVTTTGSVSSSTSSDSVPSASCDARIQSCPSCNETTIQDDLGRPFQTLCQIEIQSSQTNTELVLGSAAACMDACQGNCLAATYIWEGVCYLSIGGNLTFHDRANGYRVTSYLRLGSLDGSSGPSLTGPASLPVTRSSLSFNPGGPLIPGSTISSFQTIVSITRSVSFNSGGPIPSSEIARLTSALLQSSSPLPSSSALSVPAPTECSLANLPCPQCDFEDIADSRNQKYSVLCQAKLLSTDGFAYAEPLSLDACLAECDARATDCIGVTFNNGACVIALGQMYGRFEDTNQVAFIPLLNRTGETQTATSTYHDSTGSAKTATATPSPEASGPRQFPTDGFTYESIKNSLAHATSTIAVHTTLPAASCGLDLVTCPSCNGESLQSQAGNPYELTCDVGLRCWKSTPAWGVKTIGDCVAKCDRDPLCVGGYYQYLGLQSCWTCESGTYGTHALPGYTSFSRQHLPWKPMPLIIPTISLGIATTTPILAV